MQDCLVIQLKYKIIQHRMKQRAICQKNLINMTSLLGIQNMLTIGKWRLTLAP